MGERPLQDTHPIYLSTSQMDPARGYCKWGGRDYRVLVLGLSQFWPTRRGMWTSPDQAWSHSSACLSASWASSLPGVCWPPTAPVLHPPGPGA
eukprot:1720485-Pyramimonas_sp.AAC.1